MVCLCRLGTKPGDFLLAPGDAITEPGAARGFETIDHVADRPILAEYDKRVRVCHGHLAPTDLQVRRKWSLLQTNCRFHASSSEPRRRSGHSRDVMAPHIKKDILYITS
jgi:hypothetical protein